MKHKKSYNKNKTCLDCPKPITNYSVRCNSCAKKQNKNGMFGKKLSKGHRDKISKGNRNKIVSKETRKKIRAGLIGVKKNSIHRKNLSLANIKKWKDIKYRTKMIEAHRRKWKRQKYRNKQTYLIRKGSQTKPNKAELLLETVLIKLFGKKYKYVGDGYTIINGFCPDFIDFKNRKIIELFGRYWHKDSSEKDKLRLKTYKRYGYKTLVIWDDELKKPSFLKRKLKKFEVIT